MDNWLLIIVGTIFLICIAFGYVRGFLKLGLSLLSTILTLVLVLFLSPHVTRALKEYTPVDDFLESKVTEKFMPEITSEQLQSDRNAIGKSYGGRHLQVKRDGLGCARHYGG